MALMNQMQGRGPRPLCCTSQLPLASASSPASLDWGTHQRVLLALLFVLIQLPQHQNYPFKNQPSHHSSITCRLPPLSPLAKVI